MHNISTLILKHMRNEISGEEEAKLQELIAAHPENKKLFDELNDEEYLKSKMREIDLEKSFKKLISRL